MKRLLLTGAGGFIGSHVLRHVLAETDWEVVATDSFRHKGKTDRIALSLAGIPDGYVRTQVITHDLTAPFSSQMIGRMGRIDYVLAMASESHVDRSIAHPAPFVLNNVQLILSTLEYARVARPDMVLVVSTDEVYGPVQDTDHDLMMPHDMSRWPEVACPPNCPANGAVTAHPEWSTILPSNPYSASKAAQEAIAISYWRTYGLPIVITNTMNVIGEMQDPEKFVPRLIGHVAQRRPITIHGSPGNIGSRHYIHARNAADAWLFIMRNLPAHQYSGGQCDRPDRYNVAGEERITNLDLANRVARIIGKPLEYVLEDFHSTRPGHDAHYGLDGAKLAAAGWKPPVGFDASLAKTVRWTLAHPEWLLP